MTNKLLDAIAKISLAGLEAHLNRAPLVVIQFDSPGDRARFVQQSLASVSPAVAAEIETPTGDAMEEIKVAGVTVRFKVVREALYNG